MADTKEGRDKKARDEENRQRQRELKEARERGDEAEPPEGPGGDPEALREEREARDSPRTCHRRGCDEPATFVVLERYQEETGHGTVEAEAFLCREHTTEERPTNLDNAGPDYLFRVVPISETDDPNTV